MIHQDDEITIPAFHGPWNTKQEQSRAFPCDDGDGAVTVPAFMLNELLSKLYGNVGRHPCAECCERDGVITAADMRGSKALVCEACATLSPVQRDYAITSQERELLVAGVQ